MYPMQSPTAASESCNSSGGSLWLKSTWGAVWLARRPSFNSWRNILPITMSSSSLNIVLNTTVTRSLFASTYLRRQTCYIASFILFFAESLECKILHSLLVSVMNHGSGWVHLTLWQIKIFLLKVKVLFKDTGKTVPLQQANFLHQRFPILWQIFQVYQHWYIVAWKLNKKSLLVLLWENVK